MDFKQTQMFQSSKLKIDRARKHISDLEEIATKFLKGKIGEVRTEIDSNSGNNVLKFEVTKPVPMDIPVVVGDAVHNLCAALDMMIWELVFSKNPTLPNTSTKFPFYEKRQQLIGCIDNGKLKTAYPAVADVIIDKIQPYRGGDHDALYRLHCLDILDKHKLLIPTVTTVGVSNIRAVDDNGGTIHIGHVSIVGGTGQLNMISSRNALRVEDYGQATFSMLFGKGQFFDGEPVIPKLSYLAGMAHGVIMTITDALS